MTKSKIDKTSAATAKEIPDSAAVKTSAPERVWVWLAVALTLGAWAVLMLANGIVAVVAGIIAAAVGFIAIHRSRNGLRRIAITVTVASMVLVVVVLAFIVVIRFGLK
ncbi:MAG: hypothetical protein K2L28_00440 [Muribaculaceae bacterium]|nr:hypothetical protein [Muribaculaceae bacterium]